MKHEIADAISNATYYLAIKFSIRLIDNFELVVVFAALILAVLWLLFIIFNNRISQLPWLYKFLSNSKSYFIIVVSVAILRSSFLEPVHVNSSDLQPQIKANSFVIVEKISWGIRLPLTNRLISYRTPKRGDIVMLRYLNKAEQETAFLIRKVLAVSGDHVVINFAKSEYIIEHQGVTTKQAFQGASNRALENISLEVPVNQVLLVTNSINQQDFTKPEFMPIGNIVGTPLALPF